MARPNIATVSTGGLLLTGGASRRMGQDKATLAFGGRPLAERTAGLLTATVTPVIEVGPGYSSLVCVREDPAGAGPLAALAAGAAALAAAVGPRHPALVVATDLPHLTMALLSWLSRHPAPGCIVPLDLDGRPQAVCARYSPEALAGARTLVEAGHRSLMALLDRVPVTWLVPADWAPAAGRGDALVDIDTPDDLARLTSDGEQMGP